MARLLEVSRQGFYQWLSRRPDPDPWARLRDAILAVWETSRRIFGARQVLHSLPAEFDGTTLYRVRKIIRDWFERPSELLSANLAREWDPVGQHVG